MTFTVVKDTVAPTVVLTAPTSADLRFEVAWGGDDPVGVRHYDVQFSADGGTTWTDWLYSEGVEANQLVNG